MNTMIREMPSYPINALHVRGKAMLNDKVFAKTQNIGRIK
jgi:DNA gyrase inhibitor GyrI